MITYDTERHDAEGSEVTKVMSLTIPDSKHNVFKNTVTDVSSCHNGRNGNSVFTHEMLIE